MISDAAQVEHPERLWCHVDVTPVLISMHTSTVPMVDSLHGELVSLLGSEEVCEEEVCHGMAHPHGSLRARSMCTSFCCLSPGLEEQPTLVSQDRLVRTGTLCVWHIVQVPQEEAIGGDGEPTAPGQSVPVILDRKSNGFVCGMRLWAAHKAGLDKEPVRFGVYRLQRCQGQHSL